MFKPILRATIIYLVYKIEKVETATEIAEVTLTSEE